MREVSEGAVAAIDLMYLRELKQVQIDYDISPNGIVFFVVDKSEGKEIFESNDIHEVYNFVRELPVKEKE